MAFIILLIRKHFQTVSVAEIEQYLASNLESIQWNRFKWLAGYHRIRPFLYKELIKLQSLPAAVKQEFIGELKHFTLHNFQLVYETERILKLFRDNGIEAYAYKGPAFSKAFYGDYDSRESSDIDLLIDYQSIQKTVLLLKQQGYVPEIDYFKYYEDRTHKVVNEYNMDFFENGNRKFHIELHWEILNPRLNLTKGLTAYITSKNITHNIDSNYILSNTGMALSTLTHHWTKDTLSILRNMLDFGRIVTNNEDNFTKEFSAAINHFQLKHQLDITYHLFITLFGSSKNFHNINPVKPNPLFVRLLLESNYLLSPRKDYWYSLKKRMLLENKLTKQLEVLKMMILLMIKPNISDYEWLSLPKNIHTFYYVLKPIRLVLKHTIYKLNK